MASGYASVHYRSPDPTQNLRINITLTRVSGPRTHVPARIEGQEPGQPLQENVPPQQGEGDAARRTSNAQGKAESSQSHTRVVGWQERIFSCSEVKEYQDRKAGVSNQQEQQGRGWLAGWFGGGQAKEPKKDMYEGATVLRAKYDAAIERILAGGGRGETIYTHTNPDMFSENNDGTRSVTTSEHEHMSHLSRAVLSQRDKRGHAAVGKYQTMYIMAECGDDHNGGGEVESSVLVAIKAYPNGSFDMRPGFSRQGTKYTLEKSDGSLYEYTVENESEREPTALERRQTYLQKDAFERAAGIRRNVVGAEFVPLPEGGPDALRVMFLAEIMAARRFPRDHLMVEYFVKFDPKIWALQAPEPNPGVRKPQGKGKDGRGRPASAPPSSDEAPPGLRGVTQVCRARVQGVDPRTGEAAYEVAHFGMPIELELVAASPPPPSHWPVIYFKVASHDPWKRYSVDGYGYLNLYDACPGVKTHVVDTWAPLGTVSDRLHGHFVGGMPELEDISYVGFPEGWGKGPTSRFGLNTVASGQIQVRTMSLVHERRPAGPAPRAMRAAEKKQHKKSVHLIVERARARLKEARGGDVGVRREAVQRSALTAAEPFAKRVADDRPEILRHPQSVTVDRGARATFEVRARGPGGGRLRYQWFKDMKRLPGETGEVLIVPGAGENDEGLYMVEVSGASGTKRNSDDARLTLRGATRSVSRQSVAAPRVREGLPKDVQVRAGQDAAFEVEVDGEKPISYTWYHDDKRVPEGDARVLRLRGARAADEGRYWCEVQNAGGRDTSRKARLELLPEEKSRALPPPAAREPGAPTISRHPADESVVEGDPAVFEVVAEGEGPLAYQWKKGGARVAGAGGRESVLKISSTTMADRGAYTCAVRLASGSGHEVETRPAKLSVREKEAQEAPSIVVDLLPLSPVADEGNIVNFHVEVTGSKPLTYRWTHDGAPVRGEEGTDLSVKVAYETAGDYQVEATNAYGRVMSQTATLTVAAPDIFTLMEQYFEKRETRLKELFMQHDKDKNNKLSTKELHLLVSKVHPRITKAELKHFKVMVDADGDGYVTYKELQIAMKESKRTGHFLRDPESDREGTVSVGDVLTRMAEHLETTGSTAKKAFEEFDTDKSGFLEREEIMKMFRRALPSISPEDMRLVMQHLYELDENGDDKLTYDELAAALRKKPKGPRRADLGRQGGLAKTPREKEMEKFRLSRQSRDKAGSDDDDDDKKKAASRPLGKLPAL